ncbi:MAG: carbonic anhydrase [Ignavibacteria bacterium]|nr:carbonic anhydrase [Ignavibacteria bacterium]
MESYQRLLLNNKAWVQDKLNLHRDFFERSAADQRPEFLWIGCSDSRVPAEEITGAEPGELFVHRNIANLVIHTDFNVLSVIQFATQVLKVKHIIVCGHYGCGGIKTAMTRRDLGLINKWLRHIKDVYHSNQLELGSISDDQMRYKRLVELNVVEQVNHLAQISIVQRSWRTENQPTLHGWVYDIHTGLLKSLVQIKPGTISDNIYRYDFEDLP